ncbi:MAG: GntR family transcriptional regulator [Paracoccaceae bacterium]
MSDDASTIDEAFSRIARAIDRASSIPVAVQLRGALEYGIGTGEIPAGARLPSVRNLAQTLGLSPVTVSHVYATLQSAGHIEGRIGSGTFVAESRELSRPRPEQLRELESRIGELVRLGASIGLTPAELAFRITGTPTAPRRGMRLLMLGKFQDATEFYAQEIRRHLGGGDEILARTIQPLSDHQRPPVDRVVAARPSRAAAEALFPGTPVVGITLIPNETTRVALAAIPPEAHVAVVSYFPDFMTIMKTGIMRFAPHVTQMTAMVRDDPGLPGLLNRADVLIHSTGADYLRDQFAPNKAAVEYRHTPDNNSIRSELLPAIEARRARAAGQTQNEKDGSREDHRQQLD